MSGEDRARQFFRDRPQGLRAFETLRDCIGSFCPDATISVQDSLISFRTSAGFAYVSLPGDGSGVLFNLAVVSRRPVDSHRVSRVVRTDGGTCMCHIAVRSEEDIDHELKGWIRQSYEYSRLPYLRRA